MSVNLTVTLSVLNQCITSQNEHTHIHLYICVCKYVHILHLYRKWETNEKERDKFNTLKDIVWIYA